MPISKHRRAKVLGPLKVPDGLVTLRTPRLRDAEVWSAARLANREWLERAFPAWGDDWAAEQQPADWVERWWRLRRLSRRGLAKPYFIELDGRLIGELGIDAVDELSRAGEASVWMVRDHGSADVMNAASLLLIADILGGRRPVDRIISPVATSSRRGRTPGLAAVGFTIEATVARRVGEKGLVDHDIWVLHNTAETRLTVQRQRERMAQDPIATAPASISRRVVATAVARALVRGARATVRARRAPGDPWQPPGPDAGVELRPQRRQDAGLRGLRADARDRRGARAGSLVPWVIDHRGRDVGRIRIMIDAGTGIGELTADVEPGIDRSVLATALAQAVGVMTGRGVTAAVRVPILTNSKRQAPDAAMLTDAGLVLVASFAGNPETRYGWAGEQRWEFPNH